MSLSSRALNMLRNFYRNLLCRMRYSGQTLASSVRRGSAISSGLEHLEPKLMMSATLELTSAASYAVSEDSHIFFDQQATGIVVTDSVDDAYSLDLSCDDGYFYVPLPGGGAEVGADITLEGDNLSEINSLLEDLEFYPATNYHGATSIDFVLEDDSQNQDTGSIPVSVASVNDVFSVTSPVSVSLNEGTDIDFTGDAAISISDDADSSDDDYIIEITIPDNVGTLSYDNTGIYTSVTQSGGFETHLFYDSRADINGLLATLNYEPATDYYGSFDLDIDIHDIGDNYPQSELTDDVTIAVTVNEAVTASAVQDGSDYVLNVYGTTQDDTITIDTTANGLVVSDGTVSLTYQGSFDQINVYGYAGDDWIRTTSDIDVDAFIYGGDDDDQLFHNGSSNAALYGNDGDDLLVTINASASAGLLYGGNDFDSFWFDDNDYVMDDSTAEQDANTIHEVEEFYQPYTDVTTDPDYVSMTLSGQDLTDPTTEILEIIGNYTNVWVDYSDSPLFDGTPVYNDIEQGRVGDCYFLSVLAGYADVNPEVITQMVTDLGDGTYAVRFYDSTGNEEYVRLDADLPTLDSVLTYAGLGGDGEIWVPIVEKAYAYYRYPDYHCYAAISGGYMDDVYRVITGDTAWDDDNISSLTPAELLEDIQDLLNDGYIVTAGSVSSPVEPIVGGHAYTVMGVDYEGGQAYVTVYNPWGQDHPDNYTDYDSNPDDGLLRLSIQLFSSTFDYLAWTI